MKKTNVENTKRGITLIALVITIIVMLILVAVTISMAINGGLFDYAGKATGETENSIDKEQELASGRVKIEGVWYDSIDDYMDKKPSENQEEDVEQGIPSYDKAKKDATTQLLQENATYTLTENNVTRTAVIPKGFKIVDGIERTQSIEKGLVIQDKDGNEFVWIPVIYTETGVKDENGYDTGFFDVFKRSEWSAHERAGEVDSSKYAEPYEKGYSNGNGVDEANDYNKMLKSVYENKGFYIGRYEAGSTVARTGNADGTTGVVVKRDAYPYNYVGWGNSIDNYTDVIGNQGLGALALSKGFYTEDDDVGVESTLCYGIQWDAMLDFIKEDYDLIDCNDWGNYANAINSGQTYNNISIREGTKYLIHDTWRTVNAKQYKVNMIKKLHDNKEITNDELSYGSILLTTGASDNCVAKNIFDVAGNLSEWTNEEITVVTLGTSIKRVDRGDNYAVEGWTNRIYGAAGRYDRSPNQPLSYIGFRPTLYIK